MGSGCVTRLIVHFFHPAAKINNPPGESVTSSAPALAASANSAPSSRVSELACFCVGLGMAPPDFSFIRNRQVTPFALLLHHQSDTDKVCHCDNFFFTTVCLSKGPVVCQVKLSNGLTVHGPQCQSENEAKENAAFFALQRLVFKNIIWIFFTLEANNHQVFACLKELNTLICTRLPFCLHPELSRVRVSTASSSVSRNGSDAAPTDGSHASSLQPAGSVCGSHILQIIELERAALMQVLIFLEPKSTLEACIHMYLCYRRKDQSHVIGQQKKHIIQKAMMCTSG